MLTSDRALARILARTPVLGSQLVRLEAAAGRILAEPLIAQHDLPPFDASAVDGFGVDPADVAMASECQPVGLRLVGMVRAGAAVETRLQAGTAVKIMTGAPVPRGVGAVVMKEDCRKKAASVLIRRALKPGENIRSKGGEFRKGQGVLAAGARITPPVVGLLASFGFARVRVYEQPVVSVAVTGDELLPLSQDLMPGKIRDSNSYSLAAAVRTLGIAKCRSTRLKDRPAMIEKRLAAAMRRSDVLVAVGGLSVGDRDFVRSILAKLGVQEEFWRVAIKPGKPAYFGISRRAVSKRASGLRQGGRRVCLVFGLPGNPVSALVCFHQLVKPALLKMMGAWPSSRPAWRARLVGERRKPPGRLEWIRGVMSCADGAVTVRPTSGQDSHMLGGLAKANCLVSFPRDADRLADGSQVVVEPLSWHE